MDIAALIHTIVKRLFARGRWVGVIDLCKVVFIESELASACVLVGYAL